MYDFRSERYEEAMIILKQIWDNPEDVPPWDWMESILENEYGEISNDQQ